MEDEEAPLGLVPLEGRGSLPYALAHGESLVAAASWALGAAGAELVELTTGWERVRTSGRMLVVHDPLCPLTPSSFLVEAVVAAEESGAVVVGCRSVTDTVKEYDGERLGATLDRDELLCVTSPLVIPASALETLEELDLRDLAETVAGLVERFPVRYLPAPPLGRRIRDEADLEVLVALSATAG